MTTPHEPAPVRLDLWLWAARFFRTRALARQAIESGKVHLAGQRPKAARPTRIGDVLSIERGIETFAVSVVGLSDTRGPAPVAQALYAETAGSVAGRQAARDMERAARTGYRAPEGKPDKRARRLITALGDIDAS